MEKRGLTICVIIIRLRETLVFAAQKYYNRTVFYCGYVWFPVCIYMETDTNLGKEEWNMHQFADRFEGVTGSAIRKIL